MIEQRCLVLQQLVETAIEGVLFNQCIIGAQQVCHCALLEPRPVQAPLAAGTESPGSTPAFERCAATAPFDVSQPDAPTRPDRVPAAHTADTPASTRPTAAAGATPWHRAAPARRNHRRTPEPHDQPGTAPTGGAAGCLHQRLRSGGTKPRTGCR